MNEKFPQITDLPEDEAAAYRNRQDQDEVSSHEHIAEKPLSQHQLEPSIDPLSSEEVSAITAGRIDAMLLDLELNPAKAGESFSERKGEIEAALKIVNDTKPDDKKGLSPSGVIAERIEKTKDIIEEYSGSPEAKTAEQRLAALELAEAVLGEVFWEPSMKLVDITNRLQQRGKLTDELYTDHQHAINSDTRHSHNDLVTANEKNRQLLEQRNHIAGIKVRS